MLDKIAVFLREVRSELLKVNWPDQGELIDSTTVVILVSIALAVFVGIVDLFLSFILQSLRIL